METEKEKWKWDSTGACKELFYRKKYYLEGGGKHGSESWFILNGSTLPSQAHLAYSGQPTHRGPVNRCVPIRRWGQEWAWRSRHWRRWRRGRWWPWWRWRCGGSCACHIAQLLSEKTQIFQRTITVCAERLTPTRTLCRSPARLSYLKGTVERDFRPPLFSIKRTYLGPWFIS